MITGEIIVDGRKVKRGYSVKIRVYDGKDHRYVPLKIYQSVKTLKSTPEIQKRAARLLDEVEYCNKNKLSMDSSLKVIREGVTDSPDIKVLVLQKKIEELQKGSGIGILEFFDIRIKEKDRSVNPEGAVQRTEFNLQTPRTLSYLCCFLFQSFFNIHSLM